MSDANVLGHFVWHENMTTDTAAATAFYTALTGWTARQWPEDPSYTLLLANGQTVGGIMPLPDMARQASAPPNWLSYLNTPDVDETVRQAAALGAAVLVPPADIPTIGRFAVLRDPQGAVFALITLRQAMPVTDAAPPVGGFSWHELVTTDPEGAWAFYSRLFGWKKTEAMDMGPMGTYQMFGPLTRSVGGIFRKPAEMPGPSNWLPYIKVKDSRTVARRIPGLGGKILNGPMEVPGGDWIVQGMDALGAVFATHSVTAAATAKPAATPTAARKAATSAPRKAGGRKGAAVKAAGRKRAAVKVAGRKRVAARVAGKKRVAAKAAGRKRVAATRAAGKTKKKAAPRAAARRRVTGARRRVSTKAARPRTAVARRRTSRKSAKKR